MAFKKSNEYTLKQAIEEMTARGRSINVTLIFSLTRHRQVIEAFLNGLERLIGAGGDPSRADPMGSSPTRRDARRIAEP